ncbi:MAG TPA: hypothetical protein H9829_05590 [Candidatus Tetragenococcus pullicola]|nr:hypothetical protein [Candidatus Tetragenococcus pullicola]
MNTVLAFAFLIGIVGFIVGIVMLIFKIIKKKPKKIPIITSIVSFLVILISFFNFNPYYVERVNPDETDWSSYDSDITFNDFEREPKSHNLDKTVMLVKILQVFPQNENGEKSYRAVTLDSNDNEKDMFLYIDKGFIDKNIIEDDLLNVWVRSIGEQDYTTLDGSPRTIPAFFIDKYEVFETIK